MKNTKNASQNLWYPMSLDTLYICGKCYVCKQNFLFPRSEFSSYHSKQVFPNIKKSDLTLFI